MIRYLRAADVRAQDAAAQDVPALMERAGYAIAQAARTMLGHTYGAHITVVCGPGNNGGDGRIAARVLRSWGARVTSLSLLEDDEITETELSGSDLVIDALFGVGLSREVVGTPAAAIAAINACGAPVLAVDVPSGIDSDTGAVLGVAVRADATVTLTAPKTGLLFEPGNAYAGRVITASIGLGNDVGSAFGLTREDVARALPVRAADSNKSRAGRVLIVAGSHAMPGAATLATLASVQSGAGYTNLAASGEVCTIVAAQIPEATTTPLSSAEGVLDSKSLELVMPALAAARVLVIGPGLGRHPDTQEAVLSLLAVATIPVVVDADALFALRGHLDMLGARKAPTILTPHSGEFSQLFGDITDRLADAEAAAQGKIIVLKGPGTVIAGGSRTYVNATGDASLAQGGSGDVLAGVIGAFLSQSPEADPAEMVAAAVWIHGRAGERLSARRHPQTSNASDLAREIGPTMHEVLHG